MHPDAFSATEAGRSLICWGLHPKTKTEGYGVSMLSTESNLEIPVVEASFSDVPSFAEQHDISSAEKESARKRLLTMADTIFPAPIKPTDLFNERTPFVFVPES